MPHRNVLLITADDLNWDSVGCYGCPVADSTPHIDALAATGMRFERAHVTCAVCMPSRSVLATGLYPHNNGIEGFHEDRLVPGTTSLMEHLADAGYRCGILGKLRHSSAGYDQRWDTAHDMGDLDRGRSPERYAELAREFLATHGDEPFYLMVNSHDPHRPFFGSDQEAETWAEPTPTPSRTYRDEEVAVPGFLPELPEVRLEISEYFSSVRRCDDTVGAVLQALEASGHAADTLVLFLSDNGMALPFAKTNCYLHSTRTPWIVRAPGLTTPGTVDSTHFVSGIDWFATVGEWCGIDLPPRDGRSFLSLLADEQQSGRDLVFTEFNETAARRIYPMRCVQDGRFGYIFNAWSDGQRRFRNESQNGRSWSAMTAAAEYDPVIAARVHLFEHRVREELYDFEADPDALHNLVDDPAHRETLERLRTTLGEHLLHSHDWAAELFTHRADTLRLQSAIDAKEASARQTA